mmetsp:Transcript_7679/g.19244  ORF Transcript_7679/g.19244 Transcript_7679/m.19244 type:complete len:211 (-) Transcript_7679:527-1159(-)
MQLALEVPLLVEHDLAVGILDALGVPCTLRKRRGRGVPLLILADDVRHVVARPHRHAPRLHPKGCLHVRLRLPVRVLFWGLGQPLGDGVLVERDLVVAHVLCDVPQVVVDEVHDSVDRLSGENEVENPITRALGELAPVTPHNVETLLLLLLCDDAIFLLDLEGSVLLLVEQQERAIDAIKPHLEQPPHLVELPPCLVGDLERVLQIVAA